MCTKLFGFVVRICAADLRTIISCQMGIFIIGFCHGEIATPSSRDLRTTLFIVIKRKGKQCAKHVLLLKLSPF